MTTPQRPRPADRRARLLVWALFVLLAVPSLATLAASPTAPPAGSALADDGVDTPPSGVEDLAEFGLEDGDFDDFHLDSFAGYDTPDGALEMLPAFRWAEHVSLEASWGWTENWWGALATMFSNILLNIAGLIWQAVVSLLRYALTLDISVGMGETVNAGVATLVDTIVGDVGSGGFDRPLFMGLLVVVVVAVGAAMLRGDLRRVLVVLVTFALPMAYLSYMSTQMDDGDLPVRAVGSPAWLATETNDVLNTVAEGVGTAFGQLRSGNMAQRTGLGGDGSVTMSCDTYAAALYAAYDNSGADLTPSQATPEQREGHAGTAGNSSGMIMTVSTLWEQSFLTSWQAAAVGNNNLSGRSVTCQYLEHQRGTPAEERQYITDAVAAADGGGGPDTIGLDVFETWTSSDDEFFQTHYGFAACQPEGGDVGVHEEWRDVDDGAVDADACASWWAGDVDAMPDEVGASDINDVTRDSPEARDAMFAIAGHNGGERMLSALLAMIVSYAFAYAMLGLGVGAILAQVGAVVLLILVPVAVLLLSIPPPRRGNGLRPIAFKMLKATFGLLAAKLLLTLLISFMLTVIAITQSMVGTLISGEQRGFIYTILIGLSPLAGLAVVVLLGKFLGLGSITKLSGSVGMVTGAALKSAGAEQMLHQWNQTTSRAADPLDRGLKRGGKAALKGGARLGGRGVGRAAGAGADVAQRAAQRAASGAGRVASNTIESLRGAARDAREWARDVQSRRHAGEHLPFYQSAIGAALDASDATRDGTSALATQYANTRVGSMGVAAGQRTARAARVAGSQAAHTATRVGETLRDTAQRRVGETRAWWEQEAARGSSVYSRTTEAIGYAMGAGAVAGGATVGAAAVPTTLLAGAGGAPLATAGVRAWRDSRELDVGDTRLVTTQVADAGVNGDAQHVRERAEQERINTRVRVQTLQGRSVAEQVDALEEEVVAGVSQARSTYLNGTDAALSTEAEAQLRRNYAATAGLDEGQVSVSRAGYGVLPSVGTTAAGELPDGVEGAAAGHPVWYFPQAVRQRQVFSDGRVETDDEYNQRMIAEGIVRGVFDPNTGQWDNMIVRELGTDPSGMGSDEVRAAARRVGVVEVDSQLAGAAALAVARAPLHGSTTVDPRALRAQFERGMSEVTAQSAERATSFSSQSQSLSEQASAGVDNLRSAAGGGDPDQISSVQRSVRQAVDELQSELESVIADRVILESMREYHTNGPDAMEAHVRQMVEQTPVVVEQVRAVADRARDSLGSHPGDVDVDSVAEAEAAIAALEELRAEFAGHLTPLVSQLDEVSNAPADEESERDRSRGRYRRHRATATVDQLSGGRFLDTFPDEEGP